MSSPRVQHASFVCLLCAVTQTIDRALPVISHRRQATRDPVCGEPGATAALRPWSQSRDARDGHVHGGSPESRHVDAVARGMAPLTCGGGSSRRHASASACACEQHHRPQPRTAPASHRSPVHRAAPLKKPGPPLPQHESSLPCDGPRHRQPGARTRFRQAPRPLPPYGDAGSLASDVPAA
jgi:hypothetical protein